MATHHPLLVCSLLIAGAAQAADTRTTPFAGGELLHRVTGSQDLWVLKVDLCTNGIDVRTTGSGEKGRTVGSFSSLVGAVAAVNGDFFGGGFGTDGPAMHAGNGWGGADHTYVAPISFGSHFVDIPHHNNQSGPVAGAVEVVSGHPTLLDDGNVVGNPGDGLCTNRHPRTAVGISQDHRSLIIAVVDGRRAGAAGMTCPELASLMAENGAFDALNMDGGGSSTMVVNGAVKNRPSDGSQRTVGNHLAILQTGGADAGLCPERTPAGVLDAATCDDVSGWALDGDALTTPIDVHVYIGGAAGSGARGFPVTAATRRQDLCDFFQGDGAVCEHGFHFPVPFSLRDRQPREVFAYAIDTGPGGGAGSRGNPLLTNSPMSVTCEPPALPFTGRRRHITSPAVMTAWGFDFADVAVEDAVVVDAVVESDPFPAAPRFVRDDSRPEVWMVDGTSRRHIINPTSLRAWGNAAIEVVSVADVDALERGPDLPAAPFLFRSPAGPAVYVLDVVVPPPVIGEGEGEGEEGEGEGEEGEGDEGEGEGVVAEGEEEEEGADDTVYVDVEGKGCAQSSSLPFSLFGALLLLRRRR